jgi:hypothetical protein
MIESFTKALLAGIEKELLAMEPEMQKMAMKYLDKFCSLLLDYIQAKMLLPDLEEKDSEKSEHQPQVLEGL